jgi:hypothetical protein
VRPRTLPNREGRFIQQFPLEHRPEPKEVKVPSTPEEISRKIDAKMQTKFSTDSKQGIYN